MLPFCPIFDTTILKPNTPVIEAIIKENIAPISGACKANIRVIKARTVCNMRSFKESGSHLKPKYFLAKTIFKTRLKPFAIANAGPIISIPYENNKGHRIHKKTILKL